MITAVFKKLGVVMVAGGLALAVWLAAADDAARTESSEGRLMFRNAEAVSEVSAGGGEQEFRLDAVWDGDTYPGVRECTLEPVDTEGNAVGRLTDTFFTMQPISPFRIGIPVDHPAVDVRATCGDRLDVGGTYAYRFTDVRVEPAEVNPFSRGP